MACPGVDSGRYAQHQHLEAAFESAFKEAQNWIETVTGRPFGDEDFCAGLENGVLLCELLSAIKPGLVKKINRFPTPIAGLDNLNLFLRGCEVLGLKGTQLFEPGDLQDCTRKGFDCSRKLKNVLITIYWLGRTANNRTSYSGPTLDLKEFEGLLSQMRKEAEHTESPKRSVRDSGYVDCWDSERSDSLSPPRHVRDNSFDSLDSFGSRSQQTPSPDVVFRGSSDGRGSDSEGDMPQRRLPDVRRDDMLARRLSCSELRTVIPFNQYLPNRSNQSSYVPSTPRRRPDTEEFRKSWSTATSPVGADRPFSSTCHSHSPEPAVLAVTDTPMTASIMVTSPSTPPLRGSPALPRKSPGTNDGEEVSSASFLVDPELDNMWTQRILSSTKRTTPSPTHFLLVPSAKHSRPGGRPQPRTPSGDDDLSPVYSHRGSVSDDPESVSMIDMRCNDVFLPAHTQVRHDHMHNQYNQFREEESHWQADLARWKSRRRSISQDLIKKEEERKMMEKMMTGDNNLSQRRKSFKTYKEIVEEKERREKELHEAYQNARTPQEAEDVLHRYAQRFSISEAVLTQLRLPRTLERSMSAEPATPAQEPSPMKYLRQQSLPVPRFTSTVEAIVAGVPHTQTQENSPPQASAHGPASSQVSSSCTLQKNPQAALASVQVHQTAQVDGDAIQEFSSSGDCAGGREASSPKRPIPSPTLPVVFESTAWVPLSPRRELTAVLDLRPEDPAAQRGPPGPESCSTTALSPENRPTRPTSLPALQNVNSDQFAASSSEPLQSDIEGNVTPENFQNSEGQTVEETSSADVEATVTAKKLVATASLHMTSSSARRAHGTDACGIEENRIRLVRTDCIFGKPTSEAGMKFKTHVTHLPVPTSNLAGRVDHCVWDPEEERKHQERWQQEQQRLLQEKYQLKQEKLRQNWERAQREVEAEECRYHEEERRILEETVVPLLPRPSTLTSPRHGEPGLPIVRSLADWERKQELLERQMKGLDEEYLQPGDRSDAVMKQKIPKESGATTESAWVHSYSQAAPIGHAQQNGQRKPGDLSQLGTAESRVPQGSSCDRKNQKMEEPWSKTASLEYIWGFQQLPSWEMQRTGSCKYMENNSSKLPPSSRPSDVQSQVPNRSVSGKKLCSSCGQPLGRGAAMIIETLSLYFHIGCFKCGICKGQLGDTSTGTDVRIRNGLLNCHQCYVRSRVAGQPTTL